jgi:hypothetical protein
LAKVLPTVAPWVAEKATSVYNTLRPGAAITADKILADSANQAKQLRFDKIKQANPDNIPNAKLKTMSPTTFADANKLVDTATNTPSKPTPMFSSPSALVADVQPGAAIQDDLSKAYEQALSRGDATTIKLIDMQRAQNAGKATAGETVAADPTYPSRYTPKQVQSKVISAYKQKIMAPTPVTHPDGILRAVQLAGAGAGGTAGGMLGGITGGSLGGMAGGMIGNTLGNSAKDMYLQWAEKQIANKMPSAISGAEQIMKNDTGNGVVGRAFTQPSNAPKSFGQAGAGAPEMFSKLSDLIYGSGGDPTDPDQVRLNAMKLQGSAQGRSVTNTDGKDYMSDQ